MSTIELILTVWVAGGVALLAVWALWPVERDPAPEAFIPLSVREAGGPALHAWRDGCSYDTVQQIIQLQQRLAARDAALDLALADVFPGRVALDATARDVDGVEHQFSGPARSHAWILSRERE